MTTPNPYGEQNFATVSAIDPAGHLTQELAITSDRELTALADRLMQGAGSLNAFRSIPRCLYRTGVYVDADYADTYVANVAAVIRPRFDLDGAGVILAPDLTTEVLAVEHLADRGLMTRPTSIPRRGYRFDNEDQYGRALIRAVREYAAATTVTTKED